MEEINIKVPSGTYPTRKKYYREILDIFFRMGSEWRTGGTDYRMSYLVPDIDLYVCLSMLNCKLVLTFSHTLENTNGRSIDLDELREISSSEINNRPIESDIDDSDTHEPEIFKIL